jgi:predicted acyl esterase
VYRLDGVAPTPVLLIRTPYDKEHPEVGTAFWRAVLAGYAVVIQDLRGWDRAAFCVGF